MKQYFSILILLLIQFVSKIAFGNHLIGGDFQLKHIKGNEYSVIFNMYFDKANGNPLAKDPFIAIAVFSKKDNSLVDTLELPLDNTNSLNYLNPECTGTEFEIDQLVYKEDFIFSPDQYSDTNGYYLAWERCCRNGNIINLKSADETGAAFMLEFPALSESTYNSPAFKPIGSKVACMNDLFEADFGAEDPDGDSLVYSLITPLMGNTTTLEPLVFPGTIPFKPVLWNDGFSLDHITSGKLPLSINPSTGILSFNSDVRGLFAFTVECREYRNNQLIGKLSREYQLPVVNCNNNRKPEIFVMGQENKLQTKAGEGACIDLAIVDDENVMESISFSYSNKNYFGFTKLSAYEIMTGKDTSIVRLCLDSCAPPGSSVLNLQVRDKSCFSQSGHLSVPVEVVDFSDPVQHTLLPGETDVILLPDEVFKWNLQVTSSDSIKPISLKVDDKFNSVLSYQKNSHSDYTITGKYNCNDFGILNQPVPIKIISENCFKTYTKEIYFKISPETTYPSLDHVPNVFTPNGDGVNDSFQLSDFKNASCNNLFEDLRIFNRWGKEVFQSQDLSGNWNANNIPDGIYFYQVKYTTDTLKGYVQIIR